VGQLAFSWLTESRGVSMRAAGFTVGAYWACLTTGRIVFGFVSDRIAPAVLVRGALIAAPLCAATAWLSQHQVVTLCAIALMGFTIAPIYPLLISLTPARVGKPVAAHAIGFQVSAAALGAAAVPAAGGVLAGRAGLESLPPFLLAVAMVVWITFEASSARRRTNYTLPTGV
jgi:fucose permease